jgi:hypothetical protein
MINSNHKSIDEENIPFGIHPSKDHSQSLAPCAPAFLAGSCTCKKCGGECPKRKASSTYIIPRWATPETHHWATPRDPALRRAPIEPSVGPLPLSIGHPCALRWVPVPLRRAPVHPPLDTRPGVRLPCSPNGYRGPPSSLQWASPSGHAVGPLRQAHCPTVCINILAYHDYVYIVFLWRSTWPKY